MTPIKFTDEIVAHLETLEFAGRLTPDRVLEDARRADSPLHGLFEWDVEKAAARYWLDRSREIIRHVKVVIHTETTIIKVPRYVRDPDLVAGDQGYVSLRSLRDDPLLARRALREEFERLTGYLRRARGLAVAVDLTDEVDELLARVLGLRSLLEDITEETAASDQGLGQQLEAH